MRAIVLGKASGTLTACFVSRVGPWVAKGRTIAKMSLSGRQGMFEPKVICCGQFDLCRKEK